MIETNEKREREEKKERRRVCVCVDERKRILERGKLMMKEENPFVHLISRKEIRKERKKEIREERKKSE